MNSRALYNTVAVRGERGIGASREEDRSIAGAGIGQLIVGERVPTDQRLNSEDLAESKFEGGSPP